jgi:drug/metabolite transporter (DMT)-like permease
MSAMPSPREVVDVVGVRIRSKRSAMSIASVAVLLFAVALAAVGQVVLKHGMTLAQRDALLSKRSLAVLAATSPWILGGLVVFGCSAVAWLITLSRVPLSVAYPFNALGYLAILTASVVILHERTNLWTWSGTSFVAAGLVLVVTMAPGSA